MHAPRSGPRHGWSLALLLGMLAAACGGQDPHASPPQALHGPIPVPSASEMTLEVPPPPFQGDGEIASDEIYPCSECHEADDYDPERRALSMAHASIVLEHDQEHRWCLDCHDGENRDKLRLANGTLVPFEESYRLCGQCHGAKYRDWRVGVHGRRIGRWNGEKQYLLCVHCHDSHQPRFKPIPPKPPPVRPGDLR